MFKSKSKIVAIALIIFAISLSFINNNYALNFNKESETDNEVAEWKIAITSDTKDFKDTQEIKFIVEDNSNVVKGKVAPSIKAIATIEIDLSQISKAVDITAIIDDSSLPENFNLTTQINGNSYENGSIVFCDKNTRKEVLIFNLEWNQVDDLFDTYIGSFIKEIQIPVTIHVDEHI